MRRLPDFVRPERSLAGIGDNAEGERDGLDDDLRFHRAEDIDFKGAADAVPGQVFQDGVDDEAIVACHPIGRRRESPAGLVL